MTAPAPLARWDGQWRVPRPADFIPGLYQFHQLTAFDLLKSARGLSEADALLLQALAYQVRPLSNLQRYWLDRLEREHGRSAA